MDGDDDDPYAVLGVPVTSDYDTVKQAFLRAALIHHPDIQTSSNDSDDDESSSPNSSSSSDAFVRARQAFEAIVDRHRNNSNNEDDVAWGVVDEDHDLEPYWRKSPTHEFLTFAMDDATRKEVIHTFQTMSHGGKDKGGYWEMARQLAEREEVLGVKRQPNVKQLATGGGSPRVNRRRRKR